MKNKINLVELLRDCPKGMELDCTMFENVTFEGIKQDEYPIIVKIKEPSITLSLTKTGGWNLYNSAKCIIFPKGKTTWEGFVPPCQFKDGDIVFSGASLISIFKGIKKGYCGSLHSYVSVGKNVGFNIDKDCWSLENIRLATEEEKQILFQAIKDNGYKWNHETKTLDKLPKFKVGDRIHSLVIPESKNIYLVIDIRNNNYIVNNLKDNITPEHEYNIAICTQDEWELVPNKFNITTLIPFESKVLVRNDNEQRWIPAFWGGRREDGYVTTFGWSKYCIPYKGNEYLLNKTDDCDEYYKTWKLL
jgi:hypothetical protein